MCDNIRDLSRLYIETLIAPLMQPKRRWSDQKCPHCECLMALGEPHHCEAQTETQLATALARAETAERETERLKRVETVAREMFAIYDAYRNSPYADESCRLFAEYEDARGALRRAVEATDVD